MKRRPLDSRAKKKSSGDAAFVRIALCVFGGFFLLLDWIAIQDGMIKLTRRAGPAYRDSDPEVFWTAIVVFTALGLFPIAVAIRNFIAGDDD